MDKSPAILNKPSSLQLRNSTSRSRTFVIDGKLKMSTEPSPCNELAREAYVQHLIDEQTALFAYITTLLGNLNDASNVLQQTNLVLWRKVAEFTPGTNFQSWSRKTAYYQTLAFLRDKKRDKHIFDQALLEKLAARPATADEDERRIALRHCLGTISADSLGLLRQRYAPGTSISDIAKQRRKSEGAIRNALMRVRQSLVQCIERQLSDAQPIQRGIN
jgi:RNA polymerase sigma-70 factor (ECF subfamily)